MGLRSSWPSGHQVGGSRASPFPRAAAPLRPPASGGWGSSRFVFSAALRVVGLSVLTLLVGGDVSTSRGCAFVCPLTSPLHILSVPNFLWINDAMVRAALCLALSSLTWLGFLCHFLINISLKYHLVFYLQNFCCNSGLQYRNIYNEILLGPPRLPLHWPGVSWCGLGPRISSCAYTSYRYLVFLFLQDQVVQFFCN